MNVKDFLDRFCEWARAQPDIEAVALVGSWACDAASEDSDVDLILLTTKTTGYLRDQSWPSVNLNIQLLATRSDLPLQPGLIIDQTPQPGEEVDYGHPVGVTITKADSLGPVP